VVFTVAQTQIRSEWPPRRILECLEISPSNYYRWRRKIHTNNLKDDRGRYPSLDRVLPEEEKAVVDYALGHPQEGYRMLSWMMVDEDVAYLCPSTVYRILDRHDLLYRWKRSTSIGIKPPKPQKPDEQWHVDILYLWVMNRWYFLVSVLDAFSRYIVHWRLLFSMAAEEVVDVVEEALDKTPGVNPKVVSDRGPQFVGKEFHKMIKRHLLVEIKTRTRHPESNGLIERYHRSLREEGIGDNVPSDYYKACDLIERWVGYYNNQRLHSAIMYLRPLDYYRGEPDKLVKERLEKLHKARRLRRQINRQRLKKAA
jgi:putative transposase